MTTAGILDALRRLDASLKDIELKKSLPLGHYSELPNDIVQSYDFMAQGAALCHSTSTKYTLMGKISLAELEGIGHRSRPTQVPVPTQNHDPHRSVAPVLASCFSEGKSPLRQASLQTIGVWAHPGVHPNRS